MTALSGMVLLMEHSEGEHIVHYHCEKTDERQHAKHKAVIPEGFTFVGTTRLSGYEYMPVSGGDRFADVYQRAKAA
ncbi:hypothetical protein [Streptomyces rimosus]|uniref:hypothetical protein n=1 Tax=Streptomyces rimosus TaxID=1927 RepID=UPI00131D9BAC|nr:hypothetical protein [Streptomyces rimosus]